jgi:hypothetical protein
LVEKYVGPEAAAELAKGYDPNDYRDLEKQINLRYWTLGGYGIYTTDIPVEAESGISYARYTYLTFEAQRLIDKHGIDCVREILDQFGAQEDRSDSALLQVIKDVTGEDMAQRLLQYQTFTLTEDGISKYAQASRAAQSRQDIEQMFITQVRLLELRSGMPSNLCLEHFLGASVLLSKMGHEDASEEAMQNCLRVYSAEAILHGREAALDAYILYALSCNKPGKAEKFADELLLIIANHVNSLTVKMLVRAEDKDLAQVWDYARRICSLAKEDSTPYKIAARILAVDPNEPAEYKGPVEQK